MSKKDCNRIKETYKIEIKDNYAIINYTNCKFKHPNAPSNQKEKEINDLIFFIENSEYNIQVIGYETNSHDFPIVIKNITKKIAIINCNYPIQITNCPNITIKDSEITLVVFDNIKNIYNTEIENSTIKKFDLNIYLTEIKWLFIPDFFRGITTGGFFKALFQSILICALIIFQSVAMSLFKPGEENFTLISFLIIYFFIYCYIKMPEFFKKILRYAYFTLTFHVLFLFFSILVNFSTLINNIKVTNIVSIFLPIILFFIFFKYGAKKMSLSKKDIFEYLKIALFQFFYMMAIMSLGVWIKSYYIDISIYKNIDIVLVLYLVIHIIIYLILLKSTSFDQNKKIKLNSTKIINLDINFIQNKKTDLFTDVYLNLDIINLESINIRLNNTDIRDNENILLKIMGEYNIYLSRSVIKILKERDYLILDEVDILEKKKLVQKNLYVNSLKMYFKKYLINFNNFFAEYQNYGHYKLRHPLYMLGFMIVAGLMIFNSDNMTITDNLIASNIETQKYENYCLQNKCFELEKNEKFPFKIPKFYGEYNSFIYTMGLFLPLENTQTKSFKPNAGWVEIFEFMYRLIGYFVWIMVFTRMKVYLGKDSQVEEKE